MKYLDEEITIKLSNITVANDGNYLYTIKIMNNDCTQQQLETIFTGYTFLEAGQTEKVFTVTDILANYIYNHNYLKVTPDASININHNQCFNKCQINLTVDDIEYYNLVDVALIFRYPNFKKDLQQNDFKAISDYVGSAKIYPALEGYNYEENNAILYPRVPFIKTDKFGFGCNIQQTSPSYSAINSTKYQFNKGLDGATDISWGTHHKGSDIQYNNLSNLFNNINYPNLTVNWWNLHCGIDYGTMPYVSDSHLKYLIDYDQLGNELVTIQIADTIYLSDYIYETTNQHMSLQFSNEMTINGIRISSYLDDGKYAIIGMAEEKFRVPDRIFCLDFDIKCEQDEDTGEFYIHIYNLKMLTQTEASIGQKTADILLNEVPKRKVAEIDLCPERYYIEWVDRNGGIQCQPFTGKNNYNEDIKRTNIQNFGKDRTTTWEVLPKWTMNTGWLSDSVYSIYESLLVSQYIILYDTQEDAAYDVIITDNSYMEKTYKNQGGKLFNLTVNIQQNKKQNIFN